MIRADHFITRGIVCSIMKKMATFTTLNLRFIFAIVHLMLVKVR